MRVIQGEHNVSVCIRIYVNAPIVPQNCKYCQLFFSVRSVFLIVIDYTSVFNSQLTRPDLSTLSQKVFCQNV